jgi:hypothetical protein
VSGSSTVTLVSGRIFGRSYTRFADTTAYLIPP